MDTEEVTHDLRERLVAGEWDVGDYLPSFAKLRSQYRITSTNKLQRALAPLRAEGLIEGRHGVGMIVVRHPQLVPVEPSSTELEAALAALEQASSELERAQGRIRRAQELLRGHDGPAGDDRDTNRGAAGNAARAGSGADRGVGTAPVAGGSSRTAPEPSPRAGDTGGQRS